MAVEMKSDFDKFIQFLEEKKIEFSVKKYRFLTVKFKAKDIVAHMDFYLNGKRVSKYRVIDKD